MIPAPELAEVARIWWDSDVVPVVVWDDAGQRFELIDPEHPERRLLLLDRGELTADSTAIGTALAEGLAACDFPPTGERAAPGRVAATLRVARLV